MFVFEINGVDVLPYVKSGGLKWQRNDVESSSAGRTMDATMHRERVAEKARWDVTCMPLTTYQANTLLNLIRPEFVNVTITDPQDGLVTRTFYSNNVPATVMKLQEDGSALWEGIEFPLIER